MRIRRKIMNSDLFDCSFCATEDIVDVDAMPSECRICYRKRCTACMDDDGNCVPCD